MFCFAKEKEKTALDVSQARQSAAALIAQTTDEAQKEVKSIREGKASIVNGEIATFTETGVRLTNGDEIDADIVVTATGLVLKIMSGLTLVVDGKTVDLSQVMAYKGMMYSDVPNLASALGYTNASWTLKCDLTAEYVRLNADYTT